MACWFCEAQVRRVVAKSPFDSSLHHPSSFFDSSVAVLCRNVISAMDHLLYFGSSWLAICKTWIVCWKESISWAWSP
jgi:hypothetical protein